MIIQCPLLGIDRGLSLLLTILSPCLRKRSPPAGPRAPLPRAWPVGWLWIFFWSKNLTTGLQQDTRITQHNDSKFIATFNESFDSPSLWLQICEVIGIQRQAPVSIHLWFNSHVLVRMELSFLISLICPIGVVFVNHECLLRLLNSKISEGYQNMEPFLWSDILESAFALLIHWLNTSASSGSFVGCLYTHPPLRLSTYFHWGHIAFTKIAC